MSAVATPQPFQGKHGGFEGLTLEGLKCFDTVTHCMVDSNAAANQFCSSPCVRSISSESTSAELSTDGA